MGPIPWTVIIQYAERHEMDKEMTNIFLEIMRALDGTWIEYQNQTSK